MQPLIAAVEPLLVVGLVALAIVVLIMGFYLVAVTRALTQVSRQLEGVLGAVNAMAEEVPPTDQALESIAADLKAGQDLLEDLRDSEDVQP